MNIDLILTLGTIPAGLVLFLSLWGGTNKLFNTVENPMITLFGVFTNEDLTENETVLIILLNSIIGYLIGTLLVIIWFITLPAIVLFFTIKIIRKYTNNNN